MIVIREKEKMGGTFIVQPAALWRISLTGDNFHLEYALMRKKSSIHHFTQSWWLAELSIDYRVAVSVSNIASALLPTYCQCQPLQDSCSHIMTHGPAPGRRDSRRTCAVGSGCILETIPLEWRVSTSRTRQKGTARTRLDPSATQAGLNLPSV